MAAMTGRDLRALFEPRSVAVVGASNDPAKWGQWLARGALLGERRSQVFLVNRTGGEVLGRPSYPSLAEPPERPELVVLAVPASAFEETVDASLAAGAQAIVAIAAGLGESSEDGRAREQAVVERVRAAGAVVITRAADGELLGFVNVCRHRGHIVAQGAGCRAALQCPYHGWTAA
jgi:acetate---CoA ligase (ADP-forming)